MTDWPDGACPAARYAPTTPCSDRPGRWRIVYTSTSGKVMERHDVCFIHGLAEIERYDRSGGIAKADLEEVDA